MTLLRSSLLASLTACLAVTACDSDTAEVTATASESAGATSSGDGTGGSESATATTTGQAATCPNSEYPVVDFAAFSADPAAFAGQQVCISGAFRANLLAGGCDPGTAGCCAHRPAVETELGEVFINLDGMCSGDCGEDCPFTEGMELTVWGEAFEAWSPDGSVPGIEVHGSEPEA